MKATIGPLPRGPGWVYELKWDGMRVLVDVDGVGDGVRAWSSNGRDVTASFPELSALGTALGPLRALLDGEVVATGADGRPSFERLQQRMHLTTPTEVAQRAREVPVELVVFDLLRMEGQATTEMPWRDRRLLLERLADDLPAGVSLATTFDDGEALLAACQASGLEGVVAKRTDARYVPGTRSRGWVKVKLRRRQEVVVGGWALGEGSRAGTLGSLLVGYHGDATVSPDPAAGPDPSAGGAPEPAAATLRYAGRVGSGLTHQELERLTGLLSPLAIEVCPFDPPPPVLIRRNAVWVRPEVVIEVAFGEWTEEGRMRHPVYLGQRIDSDPAAIVREPV